MQSLKQMVKSVPSFCTEVDVYAGFAKLTAHHTVCCHGVHFSNLSPLVLYYITLWQYNILSDVICNRYNSIM